MKYIDRVLAPTEEVLHETGLHWVIFAAPFACLIVSLVAGLTEPKNAGSATFVAIVFGGLGAVFLVKTLIDWWTTEIAVTTHRVVYKRGLIARNTIEINFNRIEGLDIKQSIWGRILDFGTVIIRGTGIGVQPMRYVAGPLALRNAAFGS